MVCLILLQIEYCMIIWENTNWYFLLTSVLQARDLTLQWYQTLQSTHTVILIELTSPAEENVIQRNSDKKAKYASLVEECNIKGWKAHLFCVEVGARGCVADSFYGAMRKLGMMNAEVKRQKKKVLQTALRCSYAIYIQRDREEFVKWRMN